MVGNSDSETCIDDKEQIWRSVFLWLSVDIGVTGLVKPCERNMRILYTSPKAKGNPCFITQVHACGTYWGSSEGLLWALLLSISILHRQVKGVAMGRNRIAEVPCICVIGRVLLTCSENDRKDCLLPHVCIGKQ